MNWSLLKIIRPRFIKLLLKHWLQKFLSPAIETDISRYKLTWNMLLLMMIEQGGLDEYNVWVTTWASSKSGLTVSAPEGMDRLCGPSDLLSKVYRGVFPADNAVGKRDTDHTAPSRVEMSNS